MRLQLFLLMFCALSLLSCQQDVLFASSIESSQRDNIELRPAFHQKYDKNLHINLLPEEKKIVRIESRPLPEKPPVVEDKTLENPVPEYREQVITLKSPEQKMVDIVVVVDASGSMSPYLKELGRRLSSLLAYIENYDWQMAFITVNHHPFFSHQNANGTLRADFLTNQDGWQEHVDKPAAFGKFMPLEGESGELLISGDTGEAQNILTPQTPDYHNVFFHTVSHSPKKDCKKPPFCIEHYLEEPLRALKSSIQRVEYDNGAFFRPGADLVSLTITNEDERSGKDQKRATSAKEVVETFNTYLKPLGKRFFAFNILVEDEFCVEKSRERNITAKVGEMVGELADETGGFNISICDEDYSEGLQNISKAIETFVEQSVDIEEPFILKTFKVEFLNSDPIPWKLLDKRLIFERGPLEDIRIKISYKQPDSQYL